MLQIKKFLMKIPDRRIRRWVTIGALFAVSLLIGRGLEFVLSKEALSSFYRLQGELIADIQSFTPFGLVGGYMGDLDAASQGEWTYTPKPVGASNGQQVQPWLAQRAKCEAARATLAPASPCESLLPPGASHAACLVDETRSGCAEYNACLKTNPPTRLVSTPPECMGVDLSSLSLSTGFTAESLLPKPPTDVAPYYPIFIPLVALVHGASRIAAWGTVAVVLAILQVGSGLVAFLFISSAMSKTREPGFGNALMNIVVGPFVVIGLGSLLALLLQGVMLGALYGLSWITGLAATAAGATGFAGGCWFCFKKAAEQRVEHTVVR